MKNSKFETCFVCITKIKIIYVKPSTTSLSTINTENIKELQKKRKIHKYNFNYRTSNRKLKPINMEHFIESYDSTRMARFT